MDKIKDDLLTYVSAEIMEQKNNKYLIQLKNGEKFLVSEYDLQRLKLLNIESYDQLKEWVENNVLPYLKRSMFNGLRSTLSLLDRIRQQEIFETIDIQEYDTSLLNLIMSEFKVDKEIKKLSCGPGVLYIFKISEEFFNGYKRWVSWIDKNGKRNKAYETDQETRRNDKKRFNIK